MTLAYLGQPYFHHEPAIRELRYRAALEASGFLNKFGQPNFSPIAHSHNINAEPPGGWVEALDLPILTICSKLCVLQLDGWGHSKGLTREIGFALERSIPIEYLDPDNYLTASTSTHLQALIDYHGVEPNLERDIA